MRKAFLLFVAVACVTLPSSCLAAKPDAGAVFIRGSVGIASQSLTDWNDRVDGVEDFLQSANIPANFEGMGMGIPLSVDIGVMISKELSIGAGASYQTGSADNSYNDVTGSLSQDVSATGLGLIGNITLWPGSSNGFFISGEGGLILGKVSDDAHFRDYGNPANDFDFTGEWDGTGPLAGVGVGFASVSASGTMLFGKAGYRYQKISGLDGSYVSTSGPGSGPPISSSGEEMELDFSGVHLLLGIGIAFGGNPDTEN